jgi:shikimate kinase
MAPGGNTRRCKLVCLAGFMGCGKTTIGRHLARQLAWRFVDLDTRIEKHAGLRIADIFDRLGEPTFRQIEHELLLHALGEAAEQDKPTVLALGGGTFAQPQNVELLRGFGVQEGIKRRGSRSVVIWLDCPIEELLARCATMADRPLFRDEASFRQLYEQRLPFYQQADYRVESNAEPRRVVEQILALGILDRAVGVPDASAGCVNA